MIMATQSRADLDTEGMMATVVESCPTKIFLSNPGIDREAYSRIFHLNRTESRLISELVPRREILVKRPTGSKVLSLDVDAESYALCANDPGHGAHSTRTTAINTDKEVAL
jgi:type IV secretory pathway VirB4 component